MYKQDVQFIIELPDQNATEEATSFAEAKYKFCRIFGSQFEPYLKADEPLDVDGYGTMRMIKTVKG